MEAGTGKAIKVDQRVHTQFKSACPLHGKQMQEAATEALAAMLLWWDRGQSGDFMAFVDLVTQPGAETLVPVQTARGADR